MGPTPSPEDTAQMGATKSDQLPEMTRLLSLLAHHHALPDVLGNCPEVLPALLDFMKQVSAKLLAPIKELLRIGKPTRGLLSAVDPDEELPWTLDYLNMLAGVSDALCRLRDRREHGEHAFRDA